MEFQEIVQKELEGLDRDKIVQFAWICAVRELPFLGCSGNFDFWKTEDRQKHLQSVLYALDINAASTTTTNDATKAAIAAAAAAASAAASAASSSAAFFSTAFFSAAKAAAAVATNVAIAVASTNDTTNAPITTSSSAAEVYASKFFIVDLENAILNDLYTMKKGRSEMQSIVNLHDVYGDIWIGFEKALEAEGCSYWARLYKDIFESGFVLDRGALIRRINVPKEIREQGAAAVANYLEELEKSSRRLNEARIIILGDKGAGKTCIARRLIDPEAPMTNDDESTAGVDTLRWQLVQEDMNVHIWDFAGHTVTHAAHKFFLSERCLYIIVYDGRTEERNRLEYWLNSMQNYGGNSRAIILVNIRDSHRVDIPVNSLKEQYLIEDVYNFSIRDDSNSLKDFRTDVVKYIINNPSWKNQEIPERYYKVKDALGDLFENCGTDSGCEYIEMAEFKWIAAKNDVRNSEKLLTDLHCLGVGLWYRDLEEFDTLVLNPEWISQGVYKVINWVNEKKQHYIALDDFKVAFGDDSRRYPTDKHEFIYKLMIYYELAYETEEKDCLIIPHLLKEDRPAILPEFPDDESLMLRYKADQALPPDSISRFIVRHNREIMKENGREGIVWRHGALLESSKGTVALVREKDQSISVSVKGQDKTEYISILRNTLNDIFSSYKSKQPELQYRIERYGLLPEIDEKEPLWLPERKIINHAIDGIPYYEDVTKIHIDLKHTVNNYNIYNIYNAPDAKVMLGGQGSQFIHDESQHTTTNFNFTDCNIGLQGSLNDLAHLLTEKGRKEENNNPSKGAELLEQAGELQSAANLLDQVEEVQSPKELKKKGIVNRLKRLVDALEDEDSGLNKAVRGIKNGVGIAQDIAKGYNDIAEWVGAPQVPKAFLKS